MHRCNATLCDADPLRVLRAVRFAARFSFRLDPELEHAAAEPVVRGVPLNASNSLQILHILLWRVF